MRNKTYHILRAVIILLGIALFAPAMAQNTKGDRPKDNRGTIRRTEGKTVKKKSKASTRDIAGRRLRTKNKSSANRANVGIPQPMTTQRQPRRYSDRAARVPIDKRFSGRERRTADPDRSWQGDISGYKTRRIKPSQHDANRANVYPQRKYATRHPEPKDRPFKGYENKTASGKPIVKRSPKRTERAWRGDIKGQPFYPPSSKTGKLSNIHPQKTRYSKYVSKRPSLRDKPFNNADKVARARSMGTDTSPKNWKRGTPIGSAGQAPYVTRGRKNVYWGKFKVGGKAITRDPAGRPLSKRNFRSQGIGLTNRDTLAFFGRKPHGDVMGRGRKGKFLPGSEAKGGWLNDIAGYRLRKHAPGGAEVAGDRGKHFRSSTGFQSNKPIQGKTPGIGASAIERGLKKTGGGRGRNFGDQGGAFTGFLKSKRQGEYHGQARAALWNNKGTPIGAKGVPASGLAAGGFTGRLRGGKNINPLGADYTGSIKRKKLYPDSEFAYRGFIKTGKTQGGYIGSRHRFWNNNGKAVTDITTTRAGAAAGNFSGRIRGGSGRNFRDQGGSYTGDIKGQKNINALGADYTGSLKPKKQGEYIGSRHTFWNNKGKAITEILTTREGAAAGTYQGRLKAQSKGKFLAIPNKMWNNNGKPVTELETSREAAAAGNYQGRLKAQVKGKYVAVPNKMWNNNGKAVTQLETSREAAAAGNYQGRLKALAKGKSVAVPGKMWNNNGKAVTNLQVTKAGEVAGSYSGGAKARKQVKYPIETERKRFWNNEGKATTQIQLTTASAASGKFSGTTKYKKETKHRDTEIEDRMKVKKSYVQNPHSVEEALKKEKPQLNYKAGNFASGAKVIGKRKHNPNSVDDALDSYHNSASARRVDYQGNVRMRKFVDRRESPDAKFVHTGENNVKEDRTIMTNVKLLWAKLFQKSESQPANLKERSHKMRYDKGEKGMWAD